MTYMAPMSHPVFKVTMREMYDFLRRIELRDDVVPAGDRHIAEAIRHLIVEFNDNETVMDMLTRLPWVD